MFWQESGDNTAHGQDLEYHTAKDGNTKDGDHERSDKTLFKDRGKEGDLRNARPSSADIRAITAPIPIPFSRSTVMIGMMVSALMYIDTPMTAATGIARGFSGPVSEMIRSSGTNP